jgi:hypothetical protein
MNEFKIFALPKDAKIRNISEGFNKVALRFGCDARFYALT